MTHLSVGDQVPNFKLENQDGEIVTNESLLSKKYIIFFYPKDDSPGCTKEACNIRDNFKQLNKKGYLIFGVSPDNTKKHKKFIDKYEFQFPLLADPEKEMINSFGIWGPKKFMGREIIGVHRTTFIIDDSGKVAAILTKVKTKEHGQQILNAINDLQ